MTPHLFFGLCRALWMTPLTLAAIAALSMASYDTALLEDPATRGRPEPEKRPEPRPRLRVVGEDG